jgi:hypothetical protein
MARPRTYVEAPPVTPLPFGLLSAALVVDDLTGHAQMGTMYEPVACGDVHQTRAACEAEAAEFDQSHTGVPVVEGDPFTLYSLFVCNPVGLGAERLRAKAGEALLTGEGRGAEVALAERLPLAAGAVDLTPGTGAVHVIDGLAALEGYAARYYGGVPTIHVPRAVGTILGSLGGHQRVQNRLETKQGALVASGGGYHSLVGPPTDAQDPETVQAPGDGEAWLYVTGTVVVRRAPQAQATPLIMSRVTEGDSLAATNDATVLAERAYVASWECITAAVRVAATFSGPPVLDGGGA